MLNPQDVWWCWTLLFSAQWIPLLIPSTHMGMRTSGIHLLESPPHGRARARALKTVFVTSSSLSGPRRVWAQNSPPRLKVTCDSPSLFNTARLRGHLRGPPLYNPGGSCQAISCKRPKLEEKDFRNGRSYRASNAPHWSASRRRRQIISLLLHS